MEIRSASKEEVAEFLLLWAASEGWNPGKHDAQFHDIDKTGFLLGIESGEAVGAISAVMTPAVVGGAPFGYIGFFIVKPEHRTKGRGKKLFDAALSHLASCSAIGLDAVLEQVPRYSKNGFSPYHTNIRFSGAAVPCVPSDPGVCTDVPFEAIVAYDAPFFPGKREAFTAGWWSHPAHVSRAILDESGEVRGYGVVRPSQAGWRIGPLFADSPVDAARLLASLRGAVPAGDNICIDVPASNPAALALAEGAGMVKYFEVNPPSSTLNPNPRTLQGYLAHKKQPPPIGPPYDPRYSPTPGS